MSVIICTLVGAGIGAGVALIIYLLGFGTELLNCTCQILTCNCDGGDALPGMWSEDSFGNILFFCMIAGAIIGLIYGICKMKVAADKEMARKNTENSDEARRQRVKWADEIKQKALDVNNICERNKAFDKPLVTTIYKSSSQMTDILNELTKVAELQGKVDSIANELKQNGGVQ